MQLVSRVVAVGTVAALTLGTPTAAFAGGKGGAHASKGKASHSQKKGADARNKAAERRKKAEAERRSRFTVPGTVTAVSAGSITMTVKKHGYTASSTFLVKEGADVKRDGVRGALPQVGDRAVVQGLRRDGKNTVFKVRASAPKAAEAPVPSAADAASTVPPGTVPTTPTTEAASDGKGGVII